MNSLVETSLNWSRRMLLVMLAAAPLLAANAGVTDTGHQSAQVACNFDDGKQMPCDTLGRMNRRQKCQWGGSGLLVGGHR
jgi:hypothetical protein